MAEKIEDWTDRKWFYKNGENNKLWASSVKHEFSEQRRNRNS